MILAFKLILLNLFCRTMFWVWGTNTCSAFCLVYSLPWSLPGWDLSGLSLAVSLSVLPYLAPKYLSEWSLLWIPRAFCTSLLLFVSYYNGLFAFLQPLINFKLFVGRSWLSSSAKYLSPSIKVFLWTTELSTNQSLQSYSLYLNVATGPIISQHMKRSMHYTIHSPDSHSNGIYFNEYWLCIRFFTKRVVSKTFNCLCKDVLLYISLLYILYLKLKKHQKNIIPLPTCYLLY